MKKKVLYGAALALFASVSMGTLQSCKDDLSDVVQKNQYDHNQLQDQITKLDGEIKAITGNGGALDALKIELNRNIDQLRSDVKKDQDDLQLLLEEKIQNSINGNNAQISQEIDGKIDQLSQSIESKLQELAAQMEALSNSEEVQKKLDALEALLKAYTNDKFNTVDGKVDELSKELAATKTALESMIGEKVIELNAMITGLTDRLVTLEEKYKNLEGKFDSYVTIETFNNRLTEFNSKLDEITKNYNALVVRVTTLEAANEANLAAIKAAQQEIDELWKDSNAKGEQIAQIYNTFMDELNEMGLKYAQLSNEIDLLNEAIFGETGLQAQISQTAKALRTEFTEADEELWQAIIERDELSSQYYAALRQEFAEADEELWNALYERDILMTQYYEALKNGYTEADEEIYMTIEAVREEMTMFMNASDNALKELQAQMENENEQLWLAINGTGGLQEQISSLYNVHQADIAALDARVSDLEAQYKHLLGLAENLITGVLVQSTDSPVFGNLSLPIGVQSNILFNWFGFNGIEDHPFPTNGTEYNFKPTAEKSYLTWDNWKMLNAPTETIKKGFYGDVNVGKLFLTVNPAGNWFDKNGFSLETSTGKKYPVEFRDMKKSNKELYFGYSRGAEQVQGNGFYEVDVVIPEKKINEAKIEIEDGLKQTAKDLLKDPSKRTALNMLKAVYGQVNNMLPSYGVRYKWNVDGQDYSIVSNYNLAATTAKPLSYSFLWDKTISKRLPEIGHIDNIINKWQEEGKFNFNIGTIEIGDFSVTIPSLNITPNAEVDGGGFTITLPVIEVKDENGVVIGKTEEGETVDVKAEDMQGVYDAIADGINKELEKLVGNIDEWTEQMQGEFDENLSGKLKNIETQINDVLESINGQINDMIGNIGDAVQPYFDKLNKLVDLYNKVAGKINNILAEPNHYLQVAMFYNGGNGNLGILSNKLSSPTPFKAAGGDAIGLYASSYTGELLAPAYKKYVAVSRIFNESKQDVTTEAALASINGSGKFLNEVMDGQTIRFGIKASSLKKNYTYEIIYQGLDYYGKTSTQKFYITVK